MSNLKVEGMFKRIVTNLYVNSHMAGRDTVKKNGVQFGWRCDEEDIITVHTVDNQISITVDLDNEVVVSTEGDAEQLYNAINSFESVWEMGMQLR